VTAAVPPRLRDALEGRTTCLVLSPHLDDAVLSCGGLLRTLTERSSVTVATVFTKASPPPHTRAARSFVRQCQAHDVATLFADRRAEDRDVLDELGADHLHLGECDALFRRSSRRAAALGRLGRLMPELVHSYPTYRWDIAKGRVARTDSTLVDDLADRVDGLLTRLDAELLLCPIGVGQHVDHLIIRSVGARFPGVVYYSDFPYNRTSEPDHDFVGTNHLEAWTWTSNISEKASLIKGYRSQVDALFPDGRIPLEPEVYYS
jgi:LmbE family N-acetylglucosaminyl deacetylase